MSLGHGPYSKKDQRHMSEWFAEEFEKEVEKEGFTKNTRGLVVYSVNAAIDCRIAAECLHRGQYPVAAVTPQEIVRRLDSKYIPRSTPEDQIAFDEAECVFIFDLFDEETVDGLSVEDKASLVWYIKEAVIDGVCVVVPVTKTDREIDLNILGESFGEFMEQGLEILNGKKSKTKRVNRRATTTSVDGGALISPDA